MTLPANFTGSDIQRLLIKAVKDYVVIIPHHDTYIPIFLYHPAGNQWIETTDFNHILDRHDDEDEIDELYEWSQLIDIPEVKNDYYVMNIIACFWPSVFAHNRFFAPESDSYIRCAITYPTDIDVLTKKASANYIQNRSTQSEIITSMSEIN